jgi:hypothetical protein
MAQQSFIKKFKPVLVLGAVGLAFSLLACSTKGGSEVEQNAIQKISLGIQGFEYGPSVNKLVVELENPVSTVETTDVKVQTLSQDREVTDAYLSDENGNKTDKKSQYVRLPITWKFL